MLSGPLPAQVDAFRPFVRNEDMSGTIVLERMPRLLEYLVAPERSAPVEVALHFSRSEDGQRRLKGRLQAGLSMSCQRCLEPVAIELDTRLDLLVVKDEAALSALSVEQDALLSGETELDLLGAVEDELILGLPLVPRHEGRDCRPHSMQRNAGGSDVTSSKADTEPSGPFAALGKLKGTLKDNQKDNQKGSQK